MGAAKTARALRSSDRVDLREFGQACSIVPGAPASEAAFPPRAVVAITVPVLAMDGLEGPLDRLLELVRADREASP